MGMTKPQIIEAIKTRWTLEDVPTSKLITQVVDAMVATVVDELAAGRSISVAGLGTFSVVKKAAKTGVTAFGGTRKTWSKPESLRVKFKAVAGLKRAVVGDK